MKKIIDENGRLFGRISLIDLGVVLLVAVLAIALYAKDAITKQTGDIMPVEFEVTIENMPEGRLHSLRVKDAIYDADSDLALGEIVDIAYDPCHIAILKVDGTYTTADVPDRYDVTLTIRTEALKDERGHYYINRSLLVGAGWLMNLEAKASLFTGTITKITENPTHDL